ncbi:hypothetical protein GPECTOR_20g522 [Gonium pectorale]|uniref:N-acetyltransferase domain-containing protein n=1 Tax=Gonium pectorale TaxID=33097 RepID=A0A150GIY3_GONPE|nr:hypothetical protein GPECTOR_20g522 [Gonium pectorale]|eukprot:KXZ49665.1 hypothetical protein GPECTOR_20g522 [Gonium pectorale]
MAYLRLLRQSDLRTIQNSYQQLFRMPPPSRRALEDALASQRWLCLAAVCPDPDSPSRQEYMAGFVMSAVAPVGDFLHELSYDGQDPAVAAAGGGGGGGGVGVHATGLELIGLPSAERVVNICLLGVLPPHRRRGLARLMLRQVVDSARTASACAVFLHVRPANAAALSLYQSIGFVAAALVPDYYGGAASGGGADAAAAAAARLGEAPLTAGGDAVLLVLPLTEAAAAAAAAATQAARPAVAAAIEAALSASSGGDGAAAVVGEPAARGAAGDPASFGSGSAGPRFVGRPQAAANGLGGVASSSGSGGGGGGAGLLGILAAAAAGTVEGLTAWLPGRARGSGRGSGGGGGDGEGAERQVRVGDEVLVESESQPQRRDLFPDTGLADLSALFAARNAEPADVSSSSEAGDVGRGGGDDSPVGGLAQALAAADGRAMAAAASALGNGLGPVLCNSLDCPEYKVLDRYKDVELRRYDPATFTSTVLSLNDEGCIEKAAVKGFHRLLKYNLGDNEDGKKLAMTAPVLYSLDVDRRASSRRALRFKDRFSVSFFVPFRYQDEPPSPSDPEVFLVDVDEVDIFVRSFDGFATGNRIERVATTFLRDLHDDGLRFDCRTLYIAQYSPPFQPVFRYNEVWVLRRRRHKKDVADGDAADADAGADAGPDDDGDDDDLTCGSWLDDDDDVAAGGGADAGADEQVQALAAATDAGAVRRTTRVVVTPELPQERAASATA